MINERYLISEKLGQGRSNVFLCKDLQNGEKECAIKILPSNVTSEEKRVFLQEYHILQNLHHPSIIKTIDNGEILEWNEEEELSDGDLYFTEEYFDGRDLSHFTDPSEELLSNFLIKLSDVLFYLHQSRYIYYDLKPENVLFRIDDNSIDLKLIDFGLAKYAPNPLADFISGSSEYIAPELLRKESHDFRVDLYSLGIILYKIIYNRLPFSADSELEIYKAQLTDSFQFPESKYSEKIISVLKKLLNKNPEQRYSSALEIIWELNPDLTDKLALNWSPAQLFTNRPEAIKILKKHLTDTEENDVFTIKGSNGTGKTAILLEFNKLVPGSVYLNYDFTKTGIDFIKKFLLTLLYSPVVFHALDEEQKNRIKHLVKSGTDNIIDEVKSIISYISKNAEVTILFDNYNEADEYVKEVFSSIIPILQVNKRKLILSEDNDKDLFSEQIPGRREINLTPFTDINLSEYLNASYSDFFPINDLKKSILLYADLLPGNIVNFIKDLLVLKIINYSPGQISIDNTESTHLILQTSHDNIYRLRFNELNSVEKHVVSFISALNTPIDDLTLQKIIDSRIINTKEILEKLRLLNIIHPVSQTNNLSIASEGLKKFIYKSIQDKKSLHLLIANSLSPTDFNKIEIARQYELGGYPDKSFDLVYKEVSEAIKASAYSYARSLLEKAIQYPVDYDRLRKAKKDLAEVLYNLSQFQDSLKFIDELIDDIPELIEDDLLIMKASCLMGNGDHEAAKALLQEYELIISSSENKRKLQIELAKAEFELNNYAECSGICQNIINDINSTNIEKGKCFNFLALINIFFENNLNDALKFFVQAEKLYFSSGKIFKAAQMEMNLGNIYNIKGEHDKAELFWNKSFKTFNAIGNLEFEAKLLLNYGIYHFDKLAFEEAIENYNKALAIFSSLGNSAGQGLVLYNMGEINLVTCEYQKSLEQLNSSVQVFSRLKNLSEQLESLFLLGKVYYIAGDMNQLSFIADIIGKLINNESIAEKHKTNFDFLIILSSLQTGQLNEILHSLRIIIQSYGELDDKVNYCYSSFILISLLIKNQMFAEAFAHLNDELFNNYCKEAPVLNTERIYLFGLLARVSDVCEFTAFDYLLEAADFVQSSSVFEVTWKIFYNLGDLYEERGIKGKAEEYFLYAKSVLEYIIENTSDKNLKYALLNNPERYNAYNRLTGKGRVND